MSENETPRVKRVECGICEQTFTDGGVVAIAQAIARHWNEEHGDELAVDMTPFKTEEVGGHHLHGDEYVYELREYYVTAYDILDKSGATCGPFAYSYVKQPEGQEYCDDCGIYIRNADGYSEIDDSGWRTKYRCDACEKERTIRRRREENQSIDAFGGSA